MARNPTLAVLLALASCKTAAPIHPLAVEHNTYGTQYLEQNQLDKAQHRFELALEYNPDYPEPYNNLCLVWIKRGNLDKAKEHCIKALRLNNDFAEAHNNLGFIYLQQESYGKAHDQFKAALKINPGYVETRYNLALTLIKLKRPQDARIEYDKIIESNPKIADPYNGLCILDIEDSSFTDAINRCSRAVELDPKFTDAWFHLGRAYQGAGKHCEAQEAYKTCVFVDEGNAECRNNLASAHRQCALTAPDLKEIKDDAERENSPALVYKLGLAEKEKGLIPEAQRRFKRCIKLDGRFGLCYCELASLARAESRDAEAEGYCRKCLSYVTEEQKSEARDACARTAQQE